EILFFCVLPDLLFVGAALLYSVNLFARTRRISREKMFPIVRKFYRAGHSLATAAILLAVISLATGSFYYPVLALFLHVLLDLYTHLGSPAEPQMPLYPLQKPAVRGWIWWRNPVFLAANWAAIATAYFLRG
ncbi:MAG: hypothetical protein V1708_05325, partial [Candidatus Micrarchaeota archaeon]